MTTSRGDHFCRRSRIVNEEKAIEAFCTIGCQFVDITDFFCVYTRLILHCVDHQIAGMRIVD
jgi:hypothetical protein